MIGLIIKLLFFVGIVAALFVPLYCYVIYPILLALFPKGRYSEPPTPLLTSAQLPSVSLIIAAYNEELHIGERIKNALATVYPSDKLEILIGSDGSDDQTNEILSRFTDARFRAFPFTERRGKVSVLNDLTSKAKGEILVFSDANTFFSPDNIKRLIQRFTTPEVACVCGKLVFLDPATGKPPINEGAYWKLETFLKTAEGTHGSLLGANGANFAIRAEHFIECPANTLVEDFLMPMLILKQGGKVVYAPEAIATENSAPSTGDEFRRRVRIGAGAFQSLSVLLPLLNPLRGFPAFAFFSHKLLRWLTPLLLLAALLLNIALAGLSGSPFLLLLMFQGMLYFSAFVGWIAERANFKVGKLGLPYYFINMNIALFFGFCRWITKAQRVTWTRTPRI
jgi:poly-beta-1,6-N-acetyl-D-glucosamine synthase